MEVNIKGEAKEIAALVLEVQEPRRARIVMDPDALLRATCDKDREAR